MALDRVETGAAGMSTIRSGPAIAGPGLNGKGTVR
jgi:hypothetical protein